MKVRVKSHWPPGHIRTPGYLRGKIGQIERRIGLFNNAEEAAYRQTGAKRELVRVRFRMDEIWGARAERGEDVIEAEIYAHWLEPV
jgi:nitrile hydratase